MRIEIRFTDSTGRTMAYFLKKKFGGRLKAHASNADCQRYLERIGKRLICKAAGEQAAKELEALDLGSWKHK